MNKRGQSIIEYALIAVLVILGIYFMGPYVLRSVGAHFKLWDEGVHDSFTETLNQASINAVPYIPTNCTCQPDTSSGCGSSTCSPCCANQSNWNHTCNPLLCDGAPASYCKNDPTCCTAWADIGCGTTPIGQTPPSNNCNYGYEIQGHQCGSNNTVRCLPNYSSCDAKCLGVLSPGGLYCATKSTIEPTNLNQNYGITYVTTCPSSPTCQAYCGPGYLLSSTGTGCLRTFTVAPCTDSQWKENGNPNGFCADCTMSSKCVVDTSPQPQGFTMCAGSNASITAISVAANPTGQETTSPIAIPTGKGEDGCQNPNTSGVDEGEPGTTCQITATY